MAISAFSGTLGCGDLMIFSTVPGRVTLTFSGIRFPLARVAEPSVAGIQSCFAYAMLRLGVESYLGWTGQLPVVADSSGGVVPSAWVAVRQVKLKLINGR